MKHLHHFFRRIIFAFSVILGGCSSPQPQQHSKINISDNKLHIELVASDPEIVTPIGIVFDSADNLYVLESNTHTPPKNYQGHAFDRIKKGVDENGDGRPDRWVVFADSIVNGSNLAMDTNGWVYVTTKNTLAAYRDSDGDEVSDEKRILLTMSKPEYVYDHAGILGVALGSDDWIYASRGNLGSKYWRIEGTDGSFEEGYGIGGVVVRCKTDGSQVELISEGFWNPFDIKFIGDGRLLCTDNDPDSRGPNRLIELVPGGDYGFKDLYGSNGLHPYVSWNGELPGTLPMAAALGEAPCALIDAGYTNFGVNYTGNILVNVWEENSIVKVPLRGDGSTVSGEGTVLVQGDSTFHPVGLATNSKGDLYITDWVVREYPNHGKGKIWRIANISGGQPAGTEAPGSVNRFAEDSRDLATLLATLNSGDDFEKAMVRRRLEDTAFAKEVRQLLTHESGELRLQGLLTLLKTKARPDKQLIGDLLMDDDLRVRKMAMVYVGSKMRTDLQPALQKMLNTGQVDAGLFDTYLATVQNLQPEFIENYAARSGISADKIKQKLPGNYIARLVTDKSIPEPTRAVALPYLEEPGKRQAELLPLLQKATDESFKLSLMKALKPSAGEEVAEQLLRIASGEEESVSLRAQALSLLVYRAGNYCNEVKEVLAAREPALRYAAVKYLCRCSGDAEIAAEVSRLLAAETDNTVLSSWARCTGQPVDQPDSPEEWQRAVDGSGAILQGRLVFESPQAICQTCHMVDGWGSTYGPNLSNIGSSKSRAQLINAVLSPSLEIAPEWQGWYVVDSSGVKHTGRQIDVNASYTELLNLSGDFDKYIHPRSFGVLDKSLMPEGLQNTMTKAEFNHLIAYLESLK